MSFTTSNDNISASVLNFSPFVHFQIIFCLQDSKLFTEIQIETNNIIHIEIYRYAKITEKNMNR